MCAARGDLIDVDLKELTKFKDHKNFEPEKDGVLTREFFKFLSNLSKADHVKLCRHILNRSGPSRKLPHPKIVVKHPTTVVEDCYLVKEWIECRKKKGTARFQLHLIRLELGLYTDGNKQFVQIAWKNFKKLPLLVEKFNLYPSKYTSAPFERLRGYSAKNKLATNNVRLLFLINNEMEHPPAVKKQYQALQHVVYEKPRKYNKLQYSMYLIELKMEFYIRILNLFHERGDSVFELFAGTKLMVASVVSVASALSSARAKRSVYAVLVSGGLARPELNLLHVSAL